MNLRNAAERVGVLDLPAAAVRFPERAPGEQSAHARGDELLPFVRPRLVNPRVEGDVRSLERIERHRREDVGEREQAPGAGDRQPADRRDRLRPVDHREPFLRRERHRGGADRPQPPGRVHSVPAQPDLSHPHHRSRQVSQRREIAGGADRPLGGDDRHQVFVQHPEKELDELDADPREPERQRVRAQRHHRPDHARVERLSHPGAVRQDQVPLQLHALLGGDRDIREDAEPGRHAVYGLPLGDVALHDLPRAPHSSGRRGLQHRLRLPPRDPFQLRERQARPVDVDPFHTEIISVLASRFAGRREPLYAPPADG